MQACGYFGCGGGWGGGVGGVGWSATTQYVLSHFHAAARSLALPHITSCYAAARSLALPHMRHATSQNSLLCWWLQSLERSLQTTSARKMPQMAKLCPQPRWVYEATGRKPRKRVLFGRNTDFRQTVGLVKNTTPRQLNTHKDCRLRLQKILEVLVCCSLAQERQRQCPEQPRTTLCLKGKKELFSETLDERNSCFVLVKH